MHIIVVKMHMIMYTIVVVLIIVMLHIDAYYYCYDAYDYAHYFFVMHISDMMQIDAYYSYWYDANSNAYYCYYAYDCYAAY